MKSFRDILITKNNFNWMYLELVVILVIIWVDPILKLIV